MYIRDENHPIKQVQGFAFSTSGSRDYTVLQQSINQAVGDLGVDRHNIGSSSDGGYTVEGLSYGDLSGRVLCMVGGIHAGTEWVACYYALDFFKGLINPDYYPSQKKYLELIMSNYDGIYLVPCANPWAFVNGTRQNANSVDINRDFDNQSPQQETINLKTLLSELKPEIVIDCHERRSKGVGLASVDSTSGNLDNHYLDKCYQAIRYLTHLGGEFAGYHGTGNASEGEMRRWSLTHLKNKSGKGLPSYIVEPGDSSPDHSNVQIRYNRGMNGLYALLLANHLPLTKMSILIKENNQLNGVDVVNKDERKGVFVR